LDFTILRFGSLYGSRANSFNAVYSMIRQALVEEKILHPGDGEEIREYIHVKDAARSSVDLIDDLYRNQYLVLTGMDSIRIKDLIRMITEMLEVDVDVECLNEHLEGHYHITPYAFRPRVARKYIPQAQRDLGQGILETIHDVYEDINRTEGDSVISPAE